MSGEIIKVDKVSKLYRLGEIGTGTLANDLKRTWANIRGKEDPFLKLGEENRRDVSGGNWVWALKDVSFSVNQGDVLGIIGKNGAGKSTLLKLMSRVTAPTQGTIKAKGRIASLLEVGTGFHPDLSGRDNIYLNGAILGMSKKEIRSKFDEIVAFAGVEKYVDTPVKRYSSGMYVRLAFAVAAHLEPEILIVDEVLAVGDMEFQKKCLGKMKDVSDREGRTVLFVSHNMAAIQSLCRKVIVLEKGGVGYDGDIKNGLDFYFSRKQLNTHYQANALNAVIKDIALVDTQGNAKEEFRFDESIGIKIAARMSKEHLTGKIGFALLDSLERKVFVSEIDISRFWSEAGSKVVFAQIPRGFLAPGKYHLNFAVHIPNIMIIDQVSDSIAFDIDETGSELFIYSGTDNGCVVVDCKWTENS